MKHVMRRGDKVWRQRDNNGTAGDNGEILRIIYDGGEKEIVVTFFERGGTVVFTREDADRWVWTDKLGGYYTIYKERTHA